MDKKDERILKELIKNSRSPLTKLSKKVDLSRENIYYRIQNLIKKDIIKDFVVNMDYRKLGFSHYVIFLQYDKITLEKEKNIIDYLKNSGNASWIGPLTGKMSLCFDAYFKDTDELDNFLTDFLTRFKENIGEYLVLEVLESEYFFNKIISQTEIQKEKEVIKKKVKLDKTDLAILERLNNNSRVSYVDISRGLRLTPNAMKQRIKHLEKNKIILEYSLSLNYKAFGFEWQGLQIKLTNPNKEIETKVKDYFKENKKVVFFYQYKKSGIYDFDIGVLIKNSRELREFINELRRKFYEDIKIIDTFLVLEESSSHKLPRTVFQ
ncbi:hypothetical protein A3K73_03415 [Candidatus Pacearchaeota archaeon RBG_13_36_9]|nr:MAG: hypothetical protein A3K73_03415 [Candidatus Pacearchaeota archaeon RBG_13_36_9]